MDLESPSLSRLCVHTITTKSLPLAQACKAFRQAGVAGITVWRDALQPQGIVESAKILGDSGLPVVSLCRGGFFPAPTAEGRQAAIDENRRIIDEAAAISAPLIVLVCGAVPGIPLPEQRDQIASALAALAPYAQQAGVKLGIEPLHPMYAGDRSAVSTLSQANDLVEKLRHRSIGVAVDVYHTWWDDRLEAEIRRTAGNNALFSFHVCDWHVPTRDLLNDRGLMGEGAIPIRQIRAWVESTGYNGFIEVEIFSTELWATDPQLYLDRIRNAYLQYV